MKVSMSDPIRSQLLFHEQTRAELRARAAETLVILPVAAVEQHGPHLPVGTDWLVVEHIARAAAAMAAQQIPVLVTPTLPFGSSQHHIPFGGTLSFTTTVYYQLLMDLISSLVADGFQRIFIINGHGGNNEIIQLVARDMALQQPVQIAAAGYWTIAWDDLVATGAHLGQRLPGHAGAFESSLILALRPELVQEPRPHRDAVGDTNPRGFYQPYRSESHGSWQRIDGYSDSPDRGSAERGMTYLNAIIPAVTRAFLSFYEVTR